MLRTSGSDVCGSFDSTTSGPEIGGKLSLFPSSRPITIFNRVTSPVAVWIGTNKVQILVPSTVATTIIRCVKGGLECGGRVLRVANTVSI